MLRWVFAGAMQAGHVVVAVISGLRSAHSAWSEGCKGAFVNACGRCPCLTSTKGRAKFSEYKADAFKQKEGSSQYALTTALQQHPA